jgi:hypothetical protein
MKLLKIFLDISQAAVSLWLTAMLQEAGIDKSVETDNQKRQVSSASPKSMDGP